MGNGISVLYREGEQNFDSWRSGSTR